MVAFLLGGGADQKLCLSLTPLAAAGETRQKASGEGPAPSVSVRAMASMSPASSADSSLGSSWTRGSVVRRGLRWPVTCDVGASAGRTPMSTTISAWACHGQTLHASW